MASVARTFAVVCGQRPFDCGHTASQAVLEGSTLAAVEARQACGWPPTQAGGVFATSAVQRSWSRHRARRALPRAYHCPHIVRVVCSWHAVHEPAAVGVLADLRAHLQLLADADQELERLAILRLWLRIESRDTE